MALEAAARPLATGFAKTHWVDSRQCVRTERPEVALSRSVTSHMRPAELVLDALAADPGTIALDLPHPLVGVLRNLRRLTAICGQ
jgi:hypothetical protein